jgi:hypothetical protein
MGSRFSTVLIAAAIFSTALFAPSYVSAATPAELENRAIERKLWEDTQWLNLVHYQPTLFGGEDSQVDGDSFFMAPDGVTNPRAEMIATIQAFFRKPTATELAKPKELSDPEIQAELKRTMESYEHHAITAEERDRELEARKQEILHRAVEHPICHFPARLRYLKRELKWDGAGLPAIECYRQNDFRRRVDAKSVALVFSSFFLNNPSSTFGHSFLRINSGLWSQYGNYRNELLDTGVNFAANVTTSNAAMYALFGLLGLMPGTFTTVPYYLKVREYNDYESRDLWSYDLNLTPDEIAMLVDHIWEEMSTFYYYKYFSENCSYHMFTLLDAAAPRFGLTKRLPFYVIPSDTIRVAYQDPGLVGGVTYRPSVRSQFFYRLKKLNPEERRALETLVDTRDPSRLDPSLSKEAAAHVLDAFSDQIELTSQKELIIDGSDAQKLKQSVLIKRASLAVKSENLAVPPPERSAPHLGHGMRRVTLGFASESDRGTATTIGYRFAMHDLLDPGLGYNRNMQIDMFGVWARVLNRPNGFRNQFEFDEFNIFKLTALTPMSRYYEAKSVHAELGWKKAYDRDCENADHRCLPLTLEYGPGWTIDPTGTETVSLFGFIQGKFTYSPNYVGINFRLGLAPRLGGIVYLTDSLRAMVFGEWEARLWAHDHYVFDTEASVRWGFAPSMAIDATARRERDISEGLAQFHFYY